MNKTHESDTSGNRPLSKYAQKKLEQALGIRPFFEFVERGSTALWLANLAEPVERTMSIEVTTRTLTATVIKRTTGNIFLHTKEGELIYLSFNRIRKSVFRKQIKVGTVLKCLVVPLPDGGKDPRVKEVLSI